MQIQCIFQWCNHYITVKQAHHERNRRLEMRFRPDDQYCTPTVARAEKVSNLILKVKRRKKKSVSISNGVTKGDVNSMDVEGEAGRSDGGEEVYDYSAELLGVVNTSFRFPGGSDKIMKQNSRDRPISLHLINVVVS